jgi:hypothetical protein
MRSFLIALAVAVALTVPARAQDVRLPADFIAERLSGSECSRFYSPGRLGSDLRFISEMAGVRLASTRSILIRHEALSDRWTRLLGVAYGAAARGDARGGQAIAATLVGLARAGALLDVPSVAQALRTRCWADRSGDTPCPIHVVQHTGYAMIAMIQAAIVLEEFLSDADRAALDRYFDQGYRKFIAPLAQNGKRSDGLYEFADYGLGVLAYARWTRDARLAASELRARRSAFLSRIEPGGLIDNSSYRGYRGYWYHTLGAEAALGYALVARRFGRDFFADPALGPRLRNLAAQTVQGGADPNVFVALPARGDNAIRDPADAIPHMHQFAVNLPRIIRAEFGFDVPTASRYRQLSSSETISRLIGFDSRCYYASR